MFSRLLLIIYMALSAIYAVAGEAEWKAHLEAGVAAYERANYRLALERFKAAAKEAKAFGPEDIRLLTAEFWDGRVFAAQGRFSEAEAVFTRLLTIGEKLLGPEHEHVATVLTNLASLRKSQGRFEEAESFEKRALAIREKTFGRDHLDVAGSLHALAEIFKEQARYTDAEPLLNRAFQIAEKGLKKDHPSYALGLFSLSGLYLLQGRYAEAIPIRERVIEIYENAYGRKHPYVATALIGLGEIYREQGLYSRAEALFQEGLAIYENILGPEDPYTAGALNSLASLYETQGRTSEAESLYRRAIAAREKTLGSEHPTVASTLNNLGVLYWTQGRNTDAASLYNRALTIQEKSLGSEHPAVATTLNNLALIYSREKLYSKAEQAFRRVLAIWEKTFGATHPRMSVAMGNLAQLYKDQRRYEEAEDLIKQSLEINEKAFGSEHPGQATSQNNLAALYQTQGRYSDAEKLYKQALAIRENMLGTEHPLVAVTYSNLSFLYGTTNLIPGSLEAARRSTKILSARLDHKGDTTRTGILAEQRTRSTGFEWHVFILDADTLERPESRQRNTAESFEVAQLARASDTAEQVAKMAARHAAGSDALAQLARARQDAMARFEQLDSRILQAAGQRGAETLAAKLRAEQSESLKAITELDARLEREYPQYRELTNPKPLELTAAQKLLAEDEALVLLLVSADESFLWVLRRSDAGFFKLAIKRGELAEVVKKLRAQLDLNIPDPDRMLKRPFDVAAAHELYRQILAPAEPLFVGAKRLIFIPDGAMQSLPPGVLVTAPPAKPVASLADHAQVAWLAKQYAITVLPAAGSLRALRQFGKTPASREPFGGFGDPVLGGDGKARNAHIPALYSRGAIADVNEVRKLSRLPESADELRAIAKALKAPATSIRLGAAATERAVKEADLTRYRNLAFATHGLMAGDFKGLSEPALVFTPPEKGSELDDGLLTAGEISQLKLDADWVVLSACNTAAPDGTPGAEGLSGLARAFFYAGARSLLVSHWAVDTDAAVALTTRMFDEAAKGATKAEALRRSMLALMVRTDKPHFAHPALWAPFVVVGEGNAQGTGRR
jgi:CHAT domain-containing protein/tetratricopeptide (TPR) repeat protein